MRPLFTVLLLTLAVAARLLQAQGASLPSADASVKFAVVGDTGTGEGPEYDVGARMAEARAAFPFELVIMLAAAWMLRVGRFGA